MRSSKDSLPVMANTPGPDSVLLTPGRTRNIAQDMEALRLSRQDNPYLQQVMASRESLLESQTEESEADDTILMSQEFGNTAFDFVQDDPLTLKEVHEHMIRSPPPVSFWPHEPIGYRAVSAFDFNTTRSVCQSTCSVDAHQDKDRHSPMQGRPRSASRSVSPRARDNSLASRPLSLPGECHLRATFDRKGSAGGAGEKFSLLQNPRGLRRPGAAAGGRRDDADSARLLHYCDN